MLSALAEDRFDSFSDFGSKRLFPIGEACNGHAFLGIDEVGEVAAATWHDVYSSLDAILEGRLLALNAETHARMHERLGGADQVSG